MELRLLILLAAAVGLTACETAQSIRVPLQAAQVPATATRVDIDDQRPEAEKQFHYGKGLLDCERWYGDLTFEPGKLEFLRQHVAAKLPPGRSVTLSVLRLDTIEFCEDSSSRGAAAAAAGAGAASGFPVYMSGGVEGGDRFELRSKGAIEGKPFDLRRVFGYSDIRYSNLPSESPEYRERIQKAFASAAAEIVAQLGAVAN
jgi:hypothetical protein